MDVFPKKVNYTIPLIPKKSINKSKTQYTINDTFLDIEEEEEEDEESKNLKSVKDQLNNPQALQLSSDNTR